MPYIKVPAHELIADEPSNVRRYVYIVTLISFKIADIYIFFHGQNFLYIIYIYFPSRQRPHRLKIPVVVSKSTRICCGQHFFSLGPR